MFIWKENDQTKETNDIEKLITSAFTTNLYSLINVDLTEDLTVTNVGRNNFLERTKRGSTTSFIPRHLSNLFLQGTVRIYLFIGRTGIEDKRVDSGDHF